jgi:P27 family predicted phage terminase small subunit
MGSRGPVRRNGQAAQVSARTKAPAMPRGLKGELRPVWRLVVREILSNGVRLRPIDVFELIELCEAIAERPHVRETLAREGYTIAGRQGADVRNPLCMVLSQLDHKIARLSAKFGLTPADRSRLDTEQAEEKDLSLADALFAKVGQK